MGVPITPPIRFPSFSRPNPPLSNLEELARLLPLWPHEMADLSIAGREKRLALLRRALRAERRRGQAGHWTYDLARHAALLRCYRREADSLAQALDGQTISTRSPAKCPLT